MINLSTYNVILLMVTTSVATDITILIYSVAAQVHTLTRT
jgi:hypothetical protein